MEKVDIQIPITSESVNNLKRAISVLKEAYKNNAGKQAINNESALYVFVLPTVNDLVGDIEASYNSINSYEAMTLDEIKKGTNLNISSYEELDNLTGNYPVSPETLKEIRTEVNSILGTNEGVPSTAQVDLQGQAFSSTRNLDSIKDPVPEVVRSVSSATSSSSSKTYKNKNPGGIIKNCIPCDIRAPKGLKPGKELLSVMENDLVRRYKALISQIEGFFTDTSVYNDICSLSNFLDTQCLPDLRAIIAVLSSLYRKLLDVKVISPTNLFLGLIRPFFSPLLSGLTDLLDKYLQLIIAPINCIVSSLDSQLAKLDTDSTLNSFDAARRSDLNNRVNFLRRKKAQLQARKETILQEEKDLSRLQSSSADSNFLSPDFAFSRSNLEISAKNQLEMEKIEEEINRLDGNFGNDGQIGKAVAELEALEGSQQNRKDNRSYIGGARNFLRTERAALGSGLQDLRTEVIKGRNMINEAISAWQKELQRFLFGRAATSAEMMEGLADLQRIGRMIALANALYMFYKQAEGGKLCNNKDPRQSLGYLISSISSANPPAEDSADNSTAPVIFSGLDEDGQSILLVTSPGAVIELEGQDETKKLANLSKDNASGIIPEVGSVANKTIRSTDEFGNQAEIAAVRFNLCGKPSAATSQTLEKIKDWAGNLG